MTKIITSNETRFGEQTDLAVQSDQPKFSRHNTVSSSEQFDKFDFNSLTKEDKSRIHEYINSEILPTEEVKPLVADDKDCIAVQSDQNSEKKGLSDKLMVDREFSYFGALHKLEKLSTYLAGVVNIGAAFSQLTSIPDDMKQKLSKAVNLLTNLSFVFYGADGIRIGAMKKNPYQTLGFLLELVTVWLSDVKMKYLIRGAGTGTDQIWVATDQKLKNEFGIEDGRFDNWKEGFIKVPLTCFKMLKEIISNPRETIFTLKPKGHNALISSIGDIAASLGFGLTGNENIFGPVRDIAGALFDWELLLSPNILQKISGVLFILESSFDFIARYMPSDNMRLFMNHLSLGAGRAALMCYKNSDVNASKKTP
jgi:hypothetical protein